MTVAVQQTLFDPDGGVPMVEAAHWIKAVVLGEVALGLCVMAVAYIGALMLAGRLPVRRGMRAVVGCFMLLSASTIAAGMLRFGALPSTTRLPMMDPQMRSTLRPELPRASYNPYAQASVRDDR